MKYWSRVSGVRRKVALLGLGAFLFGWPFGGCQIDQITTTSTLDGREVLISLIRSAILSPIDTAITEGVNELFDELVDDEE